MTETRLDLRGLVCPLPALKTRKALQRLAPGDLLLVQCTDPKAAVDIPHLVEETGDRLQEQSSDGGTISFVIRRQGG